MRLVKGNSFRVSDVMETDGIWCDNVHVCDGNGKIIAVTPYSDKAHIYTDIMAMALANIDRYMNLAEKANTMSAEDVKKELARLYESTIIPD